MALRSAAKLIRFHWHYVYAVRIVWVHQHRETKIRGHPTRDVLPRITTVIGTVHPPVVLQEQSLRPRFMEHNFMYPLPELWLLLWPEHHPSSILPRQPSPSPTPRHANTAA